jgi:pyruvate dehydrogenase E1 component
MIIDGFTHQLPDIDPHETQEWLDSLTAVADQRGNARAQYLMSRLTAKAQELAIGTPARTSTPYVNTIPPEQEPWFPGDEDIERRIRRFIRWNAAAQVVRANHRSDGIGGHLSTFASSAALYEVGFNHFFRGKDAGPGDHVYIQGHASPGIYARAYLEYRLEAEDLDRFRHEIDTPQRTGRGLSSYPHPRLMPDFWEYPTVSMGLGPIMSIYQARFNKYLQNRRVDDAANSRIWSSATASATSPRPSDRSRSPHVNTSTTSRGWSTATSSASTARFAATARSSRNWRRYSAVPAGTSSR